MNSTPKTAVLTHVQREERENDFRPLSFDLVRRLAAFTRPYARRRNRLLMLVILRSIQLPALAWMIGRVIGGPVSRLDTTGILLGAAGYLLLSGLTQWTLRYRSRLALELGEDVIFDLRNAMFRHLQSLPMRFFHKARIGRVIARFTSDADSVRVGVQDVLFVTLVQGGQMLIAIFLMIWYDKVLFLVVVAMAPGLWVINRVFRRRMSQVYRAMQESFSRVTATLAESVGGIRVTQGFARQDVNAGLFEQLVDDHAQYNLDAAKAACVFLPMLEFNAQLFIAIVLMLGGWRCLHGLSNVEDLYQFILMSSLFFSPVHALGYQYNQALTAMAGAERVFRLLDTKPDWSDPPDAVTLPAIRGRVEFRNVTFAYDPGRPVLHDLSFAIEPGQTVALVGYTGSGKSSIINLVAKFYLPTEGTVWLDEHEIRTVSSRSLHSQMGIVLQQNFLFTGTVMDNIRFGMPGASDEQVIEAARKLDCYDLIETLPDGFKTVVGERGSGISIGQRQLICFARAMLANPRILILDEATSSVDTMTEARIQKSLGALVQGRTSIVVAHRLSTIRHADVVFVLDQGRIVERGTHQELLVQQGVYTGLYRQFINLPEEEDPPRFGAA